MSPPRPGAARELRLALGLCLLGAVVVLVAGSRGWTRAELPAGPLSDAGVVVLTGTELGTGVRALGLVGLAGAVALLATRRLGRPAVGVLLALAGAGVVLSVLVPDLAEATRRDDRVGGQPVPVSTTPWPAVTAAGGALLAAAGLLGVARGRGWPVMGQRYEAPSAHGRAPVAGAIDDAAAERGQRALWEALDRGEDPTDSLGPSSGSRPRREGDRR